MEIKKNKEGKAVIEWKCYGCDQTMEIDESQWTGKSEIVCKNPKCSFRATIDLAARQTTTQPIAKEIEK